MIAGKRIIGKVMNFISLAINGTSDDSSLTASAPNQFYYYTAKIVTKAEIIANRIDKSR